VLLAPAPQIPPRATLSQAHDSNLWALTFHPLGHLLVSASNDHTTRFWARERPGDAASVFAPGGAKPAAAGPDDDADGEAEDDDDVLAVPGFGSSASVAIAGAGGGWWNSADTVGGAHGGVGPGADDDIVPGFGGGAGGGSSEVPGLGSGGGGGGGSGLMANAGGRQNGLSMSPATGMDGQGPRGGQQADDWAYRRGGGGGSGRGGTGGGGGGYDSPGRSAGFGGGVRGPRWNGPRWSPEGRTLLSILGNSRFRSHSRIYIFLSFLDARFAKDDRRRVRRISS
jgi:polyadenylation factor subunit 2